VDFLILLVYELNFLLKVWVASLFLRIIPSPASKNVLLAGRAFFFFFSLLVNWPLFVARALFLSMEKELIFSNECLFRW